MKNRTIANLSTRRLLTGILLVFLGCSWNAGFAATENRLALSLQNAGLAKAAPTVTAPRPATSAPLATTSQPPEPSSPAPEPDSVEATNELQAPIPPGTVVSTSSASLTPTSWKDGKGGNHGFRIRPNLAFNFRRGYERTLGPGFTIDGGFADTQIKLDVSYLPLRFRDADGQIAYTQATLRLMRFFGDKIFVRAAAGLHWFKPSGSLTDFIRARGANIPTRTIPSYQIGAGYRLFTFKFKFWGKKREAPIFATADYTWMDRYHFGIPLGDAGDSLRIGKDLRLGFQVMLRKF